MRYRRRSLLLLLAIITALSACAGPGQNLPQRPAGDYPPISARFIVASDPHVYALGDLGLDPDYHHPLDLVRESEGIFSEFLNSSPGLWIP